MSEPTDEELRGLRALLSSEPTPTATEHGLDLRHAAGVSSECVNDTYAMLRAMVPDHLRRMWSEADPWTPQGALLRHQIAFTLERLEQEGRADAP